MKIATFVIWAACVQTGISAVPAIWTRVVERDAGHEVIESVRPSTDGSMLKTNHYTRVGNGINYKDENGNWIASKPVIESFPGGIICTGASYEVILGGNIHTAGSVDLLTSDKKEIVSNPIGIDFYDPDTGRSVLLAQIKDCAPTLVLSNQVVYADAFEGSGIEASVVYECDIGRFSQDIKLVKQPGVTPADFGMGSRTRLEILTEVQQSPAPAIKGSIMARETNATLRAKEVEPDFVDEMIDFGGMRMARGHAFLQNESAANRPPARGIPVGKRWVRIQGRTILVEAVPWAKATVELAKLPKQIASTGPLNKVAAEHQLPPQGTRPKIETSFKDRLAKISSSSPVLLAAATKGQQDSSGFVVDYTTIDSGGPITSFDAGETYYIDGQVTLFGEVQFNANCYIKYPAFGGINIEGHGSGLFFGGQIIFTSMDDDSVGDIIDNSSGTPNYTAAYAINWESYGDQDWQLGPSDFRYCYGAVEVEDTSGYTLTLINPTFENSAYCVVNDSSANAVSVSTTMTVCNVSLIASGNVTIQSLNDCDPNQDSDGDGLPDEWEVQYFQTLSYSGTDDNDGDGLTNLREYQYAKNPTVAETDSDGDGMADWWEAQYGLNVAGPLHGPNDDPDGDGVSNLEEYRNGTNPLENDGLANPVALAPTGASYLRIYTDEIDNGAGGSADEHILELVRIGAGNPDDGVWNYSGGTPALSKFTVYVNGQALPSADLVDIGFKRRGYYGDLKDTANVRIENTLYLKLKSPDTSIPDGAQVKVLNSDQTVFPSTMVFSVTKTNIRYSPAIHVNEEGYLPGQQKLAMVDYHFGSLNLVPNTYGELDISYLKSHTSAFKLINTADGSVVSFIPNVRQRSDLDDKFSDHSASLQYTNVLEVDFSGFNTPGNYRLRVDGLGASFPFRIDDGVAMKVARAYALGLYHKRCDIAEELPYTRFIHDICHADEQQAHVPMPEATYSGVWSILSGNHFLPDLKYGNNPNPYQTAQKLMSSDPNHANHMLYPFSKASTTSSQNTGGEVILSDGTAKAIDVSGGHHDAGDYSKYTINSATLIHTLIFAADNFLGVTNLNNLGIPESGNAAVNGRAIGDVLDEAKWEADFLIKVQDRGTAVSANGTRLFDGQGQPIPDGGFYTLVYPSNGEYEDTSPDKVDPHHIVWPKTTSVTAAAVGALAEIGSSPTFKDRYPTEAQNYYIAATNGWNFLMRAIDAHTKDGSFQTLYHYGDTFMHNDELAWAAAALFAAGYSDPGNSSHDPETLLRNSWYPHPDPTINGDIPNETCTPQGSDTDGTGMPCSAWNFGWWQMFEGYGCAIRDYAFAARSGRRAASDFNVVGTARYSYMTNCEAAITNWADKVRVWSENNAFGVSLAPDYKNYWNPGFYFPSYWSYDLAVADNLWRSGDTHYIAAKHTGYIAAMIENMNYECGRNPNNVSFITGLGWKRQRAIVDQYAWNDERVLPPTGILVGNIQYRYAASGASDPYAFDNVYFPVISHSDSSDVPSSFPLYDRWGDAYSADTESVSHQMARGLCSAAYLALGTSAASQSWRSADANPVIDFPGGNPTLTKPSSARLTAKVNGVSLDLSSAQIVWEAAGSEPRFGATPLIGRNTVGETLVEAEAVLPDGRRVFANKYVEVNDPQNNLDVEYTLPDSGAVALYHFDDNSQSSLYFKDYTANHYDLLPSGFSTLTGNNSWMQTPAGYSAAVSGVGDNIQTTGISDALLRPGGNNNITIEAWIYVKRYIADGNQRSIFALREPSNTGDTYYANWSLVSDGNSSAPHLDGPGGQNLVSSVIWGSVVTPNTWHLLKITVSDASGSNKANVYIDRNNVASNIAIANFFPNGNNWTLYAGDFVGNVDEIRISNIVR